MAARSDWDVSLGGRFPGLLPCCDAGGAMDEGWVPRARAEL